MQRLTFIFLFMAAMILGARAVGGVATKNVTPQDRGSEKSNTGPAASIINFSDNFDSYTAGTQLVVQNGTDWGTWSGPSGTGEDPFVSSTYAYNGSNSVVIVSANDLVKPYGSLTTGMWKISWQQYIPAGKAGYFNTMSGFTPNPFYWVMEAYFDAGGAGRLLTGEPQVDFTWTEDTWHLVEVIVDLDGNLGRFLIDGALISEWPWTMGASGGTGPLRLDVTDLYGATAGDEMYVDDFEVIPLACADFTNFVSRCTNDGTLQARVVLSMNTSHVGEIVEFLIEEDSYTAAIVTNGVSSRAQISVDGFAPGTYTISVVTPAECFDPRPTTCAASAKADAEWEADDARWAAEATQISTPVAPVATKLLGNYPNPFNPTTSINYSLSEDGFVSLKIYNTLGEEVVTLVNEYQVAGIKSSVWNGRNESGLSVASGIYIYRLTAGKLVLSEKMLFMK
jgi:hypothetical protein